MNSRMTERRVNAAKRQLCGAAGLPSAGDLLELLREALPMLRLVGLPLDETDDSFEVAERLARRIALALALYDGKRQVPTDEVR